MGTENRYSRQLLYKKIGESGQKKLHNSKICIIGIGALGTVCSELLTRAGIGKLVLIDRDYIELNNLQRQVLFTEKDIGKGKSETARQKLSKINSNIHILAKSEDLDYINIKRLVKKPDLMLACTDNFESRFLVNDYSLKHKIPWIYGGAVADKSMLCVFIPEKDNRACFRCLFYESDNNTCDTIGVLNTNTAMVASMMVNEAIKIITDNGPERDLIHFDLSNNSFQKIKTKKNKYCQACAGIYDFLEGKKHTKTVKLCGEHMFQIKNRNNDYQKIKKTLSGLGKVISFKGVFHYKNITLFKDGRALIRAKSESEARSLYSKYIGN